MKKVLLPSFLFSLACTAQAATITVDNSTDGSVSGACTLRDAVATANAQSGVPVNGCTASGAGSNTIEFASSLANQTIDVQAPGEITITSDLIINASSSGGTVTLDANNSNGIFNVTGGSSLSITGVEFVNGNDGAISVSAASHTLTLEGCVFEDNQASWQGGAVYNGASNSAINIHNSTFRNNISTNEGGAVATWGSVTISNSTFSNNSTTSSDGGAVFADIDATVSDSTFSDNSANQSGGAVIAYNTATISNSTFSGNRAETGGGAVLAGMLDARHLTLLNNTATDPSGGQALRVFSGPATLHNSVIIGSDNASDQCAGVAFTGSHNLEGWVDALGDWQPIAAVTTCGSTAPVTVSNGTALTTIINSTPTDNGGPTLTLALPAGSPAVGAADKTGGTSQMLNDQGAWVDATLDQRGYPRSAITLGRDLGAYEDRRTPPPSGSGTPIPTLPVPLLLLLAALVGAAATARRR